MDPIHGLILSGNLSSSNVTENGRFIRASVIEPRCSRPFPGHACRPIPSLGRGVDGGPSVAGDVTAYIPMNMAAVTSTTNVRMETFRIT